MRVMAMLLLLLTQPAVDGLAEAFSLPSGKGRLEVFPVGDWAMRGEDIGEYRIQVAPKSPRINAGCTFHVATEGSDDFPTEEKLARQVTVATMRLLAAGNFVERKPVVKQFYSTQGFGFYTILTDAKLVGRPPVKDDFKIICLGLIRLAPAVLVRVQILSDGEETEEFQQLLGMAEGMTLKPR